MENHDKEKALAGLGRGTQAILDSLTAVTIGLR
jgi:hypothetical protein